MDDELEAIMGGRTDFVTATLRAGGKVDGDLADNYQDAEDHVSETPIDGDDSRKADAASVTPQSPSQPPAQVDPPQRRKSDMARGSKWARTIGGNGRATIATLSYDNERKATT